MVFIKEYFPSKHWVFFHSDHQAITSSVNPHLTKLIFPLFPI